MWRLLLVGIGLTNAQTVTDDGIPVCQPDDKNVTMNFYLTVLNISCLSLLCLVLIINIHKKLNAKPRTLYRNGKELSIDSFDMTMYNKSQTRSIYPATEEVGYSSGSIRGPDVPIYDAGIQSPSFERGPANYATAGRSHQGLPVMYEHDDNIEPHHLGTHSRKFSQSFDQPLYDEPRASRKNSVPVMYGNI